MEYTKQGLKIAKEVVDKASVGNSYCNLGSAYGSLLEDFIKGFEYLEQSLKTVKELVDNASVGNSYCNLRSAYGSLLGDFSESFEYCEQALKTAKEVVDKASVGNSYCNLGSAFGSLLGYFSKSLEYREQALKIANGNISRALEYVSHALKIFKELIDKASVGNSYICLGIYNNNYGDFITAMDLFKHAVKIVNEVVDIASEGYSYCNLGNAYHSLENFGRAKEYYEHALNIFNELVYKTTEEVIYYNLGDVYSILGDLSKATEYYEQSLKITKEVGEKADEGYIYCSLGQAYLALGDFSSAMKYFENALKIAKEVGDKVCEGRSCCCLGSTYGILGNNIKAKEFYDQALKISKEVEDKAVVGAIYFVLGIIHDNLKYCSSAIENFEHALKIAKEVRDKNNQGKTYSNLGKVYCKSRDFRRGTEYFEHALKIAKEVRSKACTANALGGLSCILLSQGSLPRALYYCQSSVKMFNEIRTSLQSKEEWKITFRDVYSFVYNLLWRVYLEQEEVVAALFAVEEGRAQALRDRMELKYGSEEVNNQSHFPDKSARGLLSCLSSQIVFMALGDEGIYFWVIQNGKDIKSRCKIVKEFIFQKEVEFYIEFLNQNARQEMGTRTGVICENLSLCEPCDEQSANERNPDNLSNTVPSKGNALRELYDIIIAPIADLVNGEELIFAPQGPLCLVPYAALVDSESKFLCESFRIRVIPSLTSLKLITDCPAEFHNKTGALLVGDPCLEEVRYKGRKLQKLPYARKEVEMIGRIHETVPLIGEKAIKDEVLKGLSSVALVHIAAHGRMETGEIFLAPNPTQAGCQPKEEDYLLTMKDVFQAELRARLVVLSCCHSARGEVKEEGVVGIARAFLGAGARSVLATLWALDDEGTMEFMKYFYRELFNGKSASEALKRAMGCMRKSKQFNAEKYWAPFVLIGDDVTLELTQS